VEERRGASDDLLTWWADERCGVERSGGGGSDARCDKVEMGSVGLSAMGDQWRGNPDAAVAMTGRLPSRAAWSG
jgi:hypothetical protein